MRHTYGHRIARPIHLKLTHERRHNLRAEAGQVRSSQQPIVGFHMPHNLTGDVTFVERVADIETCIAIARVQIIDQIVERTAQVFLYKQRARLGDGAPGIQIDTFSSKCR